MNTAFALRPRLPSKRLTALQLLCLLLVGCKMPTDADHLLRNQSLPFFNPHKTTFACQVEATKVPTIDAEAEHWFLEALALEGPDTVEEDRDYSKIVRLTRQAAERRHWKAMLNLASLYLEHRDPDKGTEDAIRLVEAGMALGIPSAYDRMGTYHMNGVGVEANATRAFAFWQRAAELGSPHAMAFLGTKLDASYDNPTSGFWANIPIATTMLECALGQGVGTAAIALHFIYEYPRTPDGKSTGNRTAITKARAIKVLHEGTKLGCADCADRLSLEFGRPFDLKDMLAPFIDAARGDRYNLIGDALGFNRHLRLPNLDQVLPLPPAPLPPWNGNRDTLIHAAMGVKLESIAPSSTSSSQQAGRRHLDANFAFRSTDLRTNGFLAPTAGYWKPTGCQQDGHIRSVLEKVPPALYEAGQKFEHSFDNLIPKELCSVVWEKLDTKWHNDDSVFPRAVLGTIREVHATAPLATCLADIVCPATGIWQPWVHATHPLRAIVNLHWRQAWIAKGQPFPRPEQDWLLDLPANEVTWNLMDEAGAKPL